VIVADPELLDHRRQLVIRRVPALGAIGGSDFFFVSSFPQKVRPYCRLPVIHALRVNEPGAFDFP
jgi:hypothetical protein